MRVNMMGCCSLTSLAMQVSWYTATPEWCGTTPRRVGLEDEEPRDLDRQCRLTIGIGIMAERQRRVRYEEYAAHGYANEDTQRSHQEEEGDDDDEALSAVVKVAPTRTHSSRTTLATTGRPRHAASQSHRQNDTYIAAFDAGCEELKRTTGCRQRTNSSASRTRLASSPESGHDQHLQVTSRNRPQSAQVKATTATVLASSSASSNDQDRGGAWLTGPANPTGTVHAPSSQPLMCMALSPDQREIVVGSSDHALYTIPLASSTAPHTHTRSGSSSSSSSSSRTRAGTSSGGSTSRARTLYTKKFGHSEWVTAVTYLDDNRIVSGGMDSKLCLWDASGVKCEDLVGHSGSITLVQPLTDELLASASYDKTVRVWNIGRKASSREREVSSIKAGTAPLLAMSVVPTTSLSIVTGDRDGCVHVVDLDASKVTRKISQAHHGHTTSILASRATDNGSALCFSGGQDGLVKAWDLRQKGATPMQTMELHVDHKSGKAGAVGFLLEPEQDAYTLLTGGADGTIKVVDKRASFRVVHDFTEHLDFIYSLHVDQQLCLSGAGNGMLHVHDWKRGELLYGLGANQAAVRAIATTPSGLVAAGDDGSVIVYDME